MLTDDEIYRMYSEPRSDAEMLAFGREVEAAVIAKLAVVGVEPVAWWSGDIDDGEEGFMTNSVKLEHDKRGSFTQKLHFTHGLYTATQLAARTQQEQK